MAQVGSDYLHEEADAASNNSARLGANNDHRRAAVRTGALTSREAAVLALVIKGSTNRETAEALGISPRTVEFHRANIMHKTAAKNLADLMRLLFNGGVHTS